MKYPVLLTLWVGHTNAAFEHGRALLKVADPVLEGKVQTVPHSVANQVYFSS